VQASFFCPLPEWAAFSENGRPAGSSRGISGAPCLGCLDFSEWCSCCGEQVLRRVGREIHAARIWENIHWRMPKKRRDWARRIPTG